MQKFNFVTDGSKTYRLAGNDWYAVVENNYKVLLVDTDCKVGNEELSVPWLNNDWHNDKVDVLGQTGYVTGFTNSGAYIRNSDDEYITLPGKTYKQVGLSKLKLISHNNNWQYIRMSTV